MMKLSTSFLAVIDSYHVVAWRVGTKRKGFIHIDNLDCDDADIAAELIAMRHLLFKQKIFDREPITGQGYELHVSSNKIRQIAKGKSTYKHLSTYSHFLKTIMKNVAIRVEEDKDEYLPDLEDKDVVSVLVEANEKIEFGIIETPAMGLIKLTKHAIDQYDDRHHCGDLNKPARSLIRRIKHDTIQQTSLPEKVIKHKLSKYGTVENLEVWSHDSSQTHYVVVRDLSSNIGTLVTIYKRHPAYS